MVPLDRGSATAATDSLGRRFEWVRLLGRGGFGDVYLARMRSPSGLQQHVAVKLLPAGLDPGDRAVLRLRDEARLLASLRHPVVVAPHDLAELAGRVALVTEFVEGEDLAACIDRRDPAPMPTGALLEVVEQVCSALEAAWSQLRVVHRDVKPQNIRIGRHGNVKLLDFGIALSALDRAAQTASGVIGTLRYLAPERFDRDRAPTPASDMYGLGCVLFEGVVGEPVLGRLGLPDVVRLSTLPADWERGIDERLAAIADPGVRDLLRDLLSHDPESRPVASAVRERCDALTTHDPDHVRLARWCRERLWAESPALPPASAAPSPLARLGLPGSAAHLDPVKLVRVELSPEDEAHVAGCFECRSARLVARKSRQIGSYRVIGLVGRGGMGDVLAAEDADGRPCALKVLRLRRAGFELRMEREAELQRNVASENVLTLLDVFQHQGAPVLVLPFVPGPSLAALLAAHRPSLATSAAWFRAIVTGVAALHRAGLVHRDLKPANILLDPTPGGVVPKIADLGLGKWFDDAHTALTKTGMLLGTPAYSAPEQLLSARAAGPPADVWSLGVIGTELFTGRRQRGPDDLLPKPWDAILDRLMRDDPAARPADASEVLELLPPDAPADEDWLERCHALAPRIEPLDLGRVLGLDEQADPSSESWSLQPRVNDPPSRETRPAGRAIRRLGWAGAALLAATVVGFAWAWPRTEGPIPTSAVATPASSPSPVPVPTPPAVDLETEVAPRPAPTRTDGRAGGTRSVRAASAVEAPTLAEEAVAGVPGAEAPLGFGTVAIIGARVELRGDRGSFGAGQVAAGVYALWADFGRGPTEKARIVIAPGDSVLVRCNSMTFQCRVER